MAFVHRTTTMAASLHAAAAALSQRGTTVSMEASCTTPQGGLGPVRGGALTSRACTGQKGGRSCRSTGQLRSSRVGGPGALQRACLRTRATPPLHGTSVRPLGPGAPRAAASGASASFEGEPEDPYKVLGLSPLDSFEQVKVAHRKKTRDAEAKGDEAALERIEKAYDTIMMQQLFRRKQGLTFGAVKVSEDIKYADSKDWFPWRPKPERSPRKMIYLNAAVSVVMSLWILGAQVTDFKVLQLLLAFYTFTLFLKLDPFYPANPEDEEKKWARNGRRLMRALGLCFGCVALSSVAHSVAYYSFSLFGYYVPRALLTFQELLITLACAVQMFVTGSYYR